MTTYITSFDTVPVSRKQRGLRSTHAAAASTAVALRCSNGGREHTVWQ